MKLTKELIKQYLEVCANQKKLNPKTLKAYRIDLRQFAEYLSGTRMHFEREAVKAYASQLNRKYKPATVRRKLASIRALKTWLMEERLMERNPFENLRLKVQKPSYLPRTIPLHTVKQLLHAVHARMRCLPEDTSALCSAVVLELLFATGLRVSELCSLKTRDVDAENGVLRILGKGAKERTVQLTNPEVLTLLRRYLRICRPDRNGYFFRNRHGGRLSEESVRRIVRKYAHMIGFPTRITPHMFRHSLATQLLEADVDIRYIQQLLGHSSILTTQIYTHVAGAKQRDILAKKHPRNRFSFQPEAAAGTWRKYAGTFW